MARTTGARTNKADLVPGSVPEMVEFPRERAPVRVAALAARLAAHLARSKGDLIVLAANERRADELGRALAAFAPSIDPLVLRPWDCLPYDRVSPSRDSMGGRIAVLRALGEPSRRRVVVTSPDAAMQKVAVPGDVFPLDRGMTLDRAALEVYARRTGYVAADRVDEPGDIAFQGQVVDVFPADAAMPVRVVLGEDDVVDDLRSYDPATQRSDRTIERFDLLPACELVLPDDEARWPGIEHWLPAFRPDLRTLFDLLPEAAVACDEDVSAACDRLPASRHIIDAPARLPRRR